MRRTAKKPVLLKVHKQSVVNFCLNTDSLKLFLNAFKWHSKSLRSLDIKRNGLTTTITMDLLDFPEGFEEEFFPVLGHIFNIVSG